MNEEKRTPRLTGRRKFLSGLSVAAATSSLVRADETKKDDTPPAPLLPTIRLGDHEVTRLVAGWNPIGGYSYMGPNMDRHMKEYYTPEKTVEYLLRCERAGINAHQFSRPEQMGDIFRTVRERGSKMKFICLHSLSPKRISIPKVIEFTDPIAIVHHGGVTDRLFREGKSSEVRDFVMRVRDAGVLAGVSAHNPDCIKRVADEGWPVDFFMTCFYNITRTHEEEEKMPPVVTVQVGKPFFAAFDAGAQWLDDLQPAFGEKEFFYEQEYEKLLKVDKLPGHTLSTENKQYA